MTTKILINYRCWEEKSLELSDTGPSSFPCTVPLWVVKMRMYIANRRVLEKIFKLK